MSRVLHYYAKINENGVCYGFETLTRKFKEEELPSNLIPLSDYNESLLWRKWDVGLQAWSSERYEPSIDTVLQDKIEQLEIENANLQVNVDSLSNNIVLLEGTITELMSMLATIGGGK